MQEDESKKVAGMTVVERLYHFGLANELKNAIGNKNHEEVVAVLLRAMLSQEQAESTAATILADPQRYGY